MSNREIKSINCEIRSESDIIAPVLYLEEDYGSEGYETHTYLIEGENCIRMGQHNRSLSKTFPTEIWEKFGGSEILTWEEYGQVLCYYNCDGGESVVFDKWQSKDGVAEIAVVKTGVEKRIAYNNEEFEYFKYFYCFDGYYYLFTYAQTAVDLADYDIMRIYKLTEDLEIVDIREVNFANFGLRSHNLISEAVTVSNNTIILHAQDNGQSYWLKYDLDDNKSTLVPSEYSLIGSVADENGYYSIGFDSENIIFEKFDSKGNSLKKNTIPPPKAIDLTSKYFSADAILYMYGSEVYMCFKNGRKEFCFFSYDVENNKWMNSWIIEKGDSYNLYIMDVKFMINIDGEYFDLYPNWNNAR